MIPDDLKDKNGFCTSVYVNSIVLGYNTHLTKGQPVPSSYDDLLQPRWRELKISIDSTYVTLLQGLISAWGKDRALDYLKKLNEFYNGWIDNYKEGPLLIIDADKNKFAENEEHLGQIISSIDAKLFGLF